MIAPPSNSNSGNNGNGNGSNKENSKNEGTDDAGYGNATNAEEHNSQNQSGILFPVAEEISQTETDLIAMIKTTGKEKDYELIEYILNVNTQYTQVLMELNENGAMDAAYTYGTARLTEDRFTGESNCYLYDPSGNVAGITDQNGYLWQSYRYDAFGNATFGSPQYDNEYTFNGESYNPNIHSQYLRARYYDTVKGCFLTEDTYLGDIRNPLTLNRYSYCIGNPLFYSDPSGHAPRTLSSNPASPYNRIDFEARDQGIKDAILGHQDRVDEAMDHIYDWLGEEDRSSAEQFVDGFLTGFAGSFYATYDVITNPEYVIAFAYDMLNHPVRTLAAIAKSAVAGDTMELLHYIDTKNYRALGQNMGYRAGKLAQIVLARAAVKKCGELSNKKGGEMPPPPLGEDGGNAPKVNQDSKLNANSNYGQDPFKNAHFKKNDIKMVDDAARQVGVDRIGFGDFIHEIKAELGMGASQNFTYQELLELAESYANMTR